MPSFCWLLNLSTTVIHSGNPDILYSFNFAPTRSSTLRQHAFHSSYRCSFPFCHWKGSSSRWRGGPHDHGRHNTMSTKHLTPLLYLQQRFGKPRWIIRKPLRRRPLHHLWEIILCFPWWGRLLIGYGNRQSGPDHWWSRICCLRRRQQCLLLKLDAATDCYLCSKYCFLSQKFASANEGRNTHSSPTTSTETACSTAMLSKHLLESSPGWRLRRF